MRRGSVACGARHLGLLLRHDMGGGHAPHRGAALALMAMKDWRVRDATSAS